jgi:putative membrane protein
MAITHTFLDFIPSIFLGAPEDDSNALSVLPGHRLLMKGYGYGAVKLTLFGSFFGLLLALLITPLYILFLKISFPTIKYSVPFVILSISLFMILKEKRKFIALSIFILSGIIGLLTFQIKPLSQPLLPLFTGLFGLPLLFLSIKNKTKIKKQKIRDLKLSRKEKIRPLLSGLFSSAIVSLYPAVGAGQAAILGSEMFGKLNTKEFLVLLGSINTIVMLLSFATAYEIGKTRTGSAAAISEIAENFDFNLLMILLLSSLMAGMISFFVCKFLAKIIAKKIEKINYPRLCFFVALFVTFINIFVSGIFSLFVLLAGFFVGLITNITGIRKIHMMGCLVIPTIFYFLGF